MADKQDVLKRKKLFVLDMDGTFYWQQIAGRFRWDFLR